MITPKPRPPGRPRGSINRTSLKLIKDAAKRGEIPPHEFLLAIMRCEYAVINGVKYQPTFEQRLQAAKEAAPYFAPRLSSTDLLHSCSDDDLKLMLAEAVEAINDPDLNKQLTQIVTMFALKRARSSAPAGSQQTTAGRATEIPGRKTSTT
jgi:hypothetical protein